jgi:hypothetical protein
MTIPQVIAEMRQHADDIAVLSDESNHNAQAAARAIQRWADALEAAQREDQQPCNAYHSADLDGNRYCANHCHWELGGRSASHDSAVERACAICDHQQPCPQHGRTPVTDEDFDELRRDVEVQLSLACMDCGAVYSDFPLDTTLPDDQWRMIHDSDGGVLCASCIVRRAGRLRATASID